MSDLLSRLKTEAKKRALVCTLTLEEVLSLRSAACTYCGGSLPIYGAGLDRIDNTVGYVIGNVVPSCRSCNNKRGSLTFDEWWLILEYRRQKWEAAQP